MCQLDDNTHKFHLNLFLASLYITAPTTVSLQLAIPIIEIGFLNIKIEITIATIISYVDEALYKLQLIVISKITTTTTTTTTTTKKQKKTKKKQKQKQKNKKQKNKNKKQNKKQKKQKNLQNKK